MFFKPAEFELKMPGSENPLWLSEVQGIWTSGNLIQSDVLNNFAY